MMFVSSVAIFLSLIGSNAAFQVPSVPTTTRQAALSPLYSSYLSSLGGQGAAAATTTEPPAAESESTAAFSHAPFSYFSLDKLTPKGPRKNADVGQPHDATRPLVSVGSSSAGSWWCAQGGWPSPALRATTEIFYVFSGHGSVTDLDGTRHIFGPGDTVILPKGWSGRWDVLEDIHKVWVVVDHPNIEETSNPIRAVITPYSSLAPVHVMSPLTARPDAIHGSPSSASQTIYNLGPTQVGCQMNTPGSFTVSNLPKTESYYVLEGVFFLTGVDGSSRRCVAGDTVVLPRGWSGYWDVIETMRTLQVVVSE